MSTVKSSSHTFNSSENTNITIAGNDIDLVVKVGNNERIRIDSNGANLIGNTLITGTLNVSNISARTINIAGNVIIRTGNTEQLLIGNTQSINIGVLSSLEKPLLYVERNANGRSIAAFNANNQTNEAEMGLYRRGDVAILLGAKSNYNYLAFDKTRDLRFIAVPETPDATLDSFRGVLKANGQLHLGDIDNINYSSFPRYGSSNLEPNRFFGTDGKSIVSILDQGSSSTEAPMIVFEKMPGDVFFLPVANGDLLGRLLWSSIGDNLTFTNTGAIELIVSQTTVGDNVPTAMVFKTRANNQAAMTESMRVDNSGLVTATAFSGFGTGFSNMLVTTVPGSNTWTIPTGVRRFKVTAVGAGGQGGGSGGIAQQQGGGGGSGGLTIQFYDVVPGQTTFYYNVGFANVIHRTFNAGGSSGNSSNMQYNSVWAFANGGAGGSASNNFTGGTGGAAAGGIINIPGQTGSWGGTALAANIVGGMGGSSPMGYGLGAVYTGTAAGANGSNATGYGSGGSGSRNGTATTQRAGGFGANGVVIIEW